MGEGRIAPGGGGLGKSSVWLGRSAVDGRTGTLDDTTRRAADQRSNLTGAPPLPDWATNGTEYIASGTSIFDPVLCEVVYSWFTKPGALVLDPFAGGSVRGVVASMLGRGYIGTDLSAPQVDANRQQAERICAGPPLLGDSELCPPPRWFVGDARAIDADWPAPGELADLIFTCPPYFDLEVYSENPADLSRAPSAALFEDGLADVLAAAAARLADDRFAVIVMGEARSKTGELYGLVPRTIRAAERAGLTYYNEAILITMVGSLSLRVSAAFNASRKIGRTHQTVLVFVKGDAKRAATWLGPVAIGDLSQIALEVDGGLAEGGAHEVSAHPDRQDHGEGDS